MGKLPWGRPLRLSASSPVPSCWGGVETGKRLEDLETLPDLKARGVGGCAPSSPPAPTLGPASLTPAALGSGLGRVSSYEWSKTPTPLPRDPGEEEGAGALRLLDAPPLRVSLSPGLSCPEVVWEWVRGHKNHLLL